MADIVIISILLITAFFIIRNRIRRISRGGCQGGCSGCSGSCGCREDTQCK